MRGLYKHYLGFVRDVDIYGRFSDAFRQSCIIQAPELRSVVDTALKRALVTGYNLKDSVRPPFHRDAHPDLLGTPTWTTPSSSSAFSGAEGINAKVQFEPKTSAFVYMNGARPAHREHGSP